MGGGDELELGRFYSRYGTIRYLVQTGETSYVVYGPSNYLRCASNEKDSGISMFDFEGGPAYHLGMSFPFSDSCNVIASMKPAKRGEYTAVEITVKPRKKTQTKKAKTKARKIDHVK